MVSRRSGEDLSGGYLNGVLVQIKEEAMASRSAVAGKLP
jgi:hypothetical protein